MKWILLLLLATKIQAQGICENDLYKSVAFKKQSVTVCGKKIDVEVADNESLREVGLMCRDNLPPDKGMLFIFENPTRASFWMKNTKIPLSIAYFSKDKTLLNLDDMKPYDEINLHNSKGAALYALEMNIGWFKKHKVKPGCKLSLK